MSASKRKKPAARESHNDRSGSYGPDYAAVLADVSLAKFFLVKRLDWSPKPVEPGHEDDPIAEFFRSLNGTALRPWENSGKDKEKKSLDEGKD